jgi:hypothetical protein
MGISVAGRDGFLGYHKEEAQIQSVYSGALRTHLSRYACEDKKAFLTMYSKFVPTNILAVFLFNTTSPSCGQIFLDYIARLKPLSSPHDQAGL